MMADKRSRKYGQVTFVLLSRTGAIELMCEVLAAAEIKSDKNASADSLTIFGEVHNLTD
jgi:hypothetical protein